MPAYEFTSVNAEKLRDEMVAAGYRNGFGYNVSGDNDTLTVEVNEGLEVTRETLQVVVDRHNPAELTTTQQRRAAVQAMKALGSAARARLPQYASLLEALYTGATTHAGEAMSEADRASWQSDVQDAIENDATIQAFHAILMDIAADTDTTRRAYMMAAFDLIAFGGTFAMLSEIADNLNT